MKRSYLTVPKLRSIITHLSERFRKRRSSSHKSRLHPAHPFFYENKDTERKHQIVSKSFFLMDQKLHQINTTAHWVGFVCMMPHRPGRRAHPPPADAQTWSIVDLFAARWKGVKVLQEHFSKGTGVEHRLYVFHVVALKNAWGMTRARKIVTRRKGGGNGPKVLNVVRLCLLDKWSERNHKASLLS